MVLRAVTPKKGNITFFGFSGVLGGFGRPFKNLVRGLQVLMRPISEVSGSISGGISEVSGRISGGLYSLGGAAQAAVFDAWLYSGRPTCGAIFAEEARPSPCSALVCRCSLSESAWHWAIVLPEALAAQSCDHVGPCPCQLLG